MQRIAEDLAVSRLRVEYKRQAVLGDILYPRIAEENDRIVAALCDKAICADGISKSHTRIMFAAGGKTDGETKDCNFRSRTCRDLINPVDFRGFAEEIILIHQDEKKAESQALDLDDICLPYKVNDRAGGYEEFRMHRF